MLASVGAAQRGATATLAMRELDTEAPVVWPAWCYSAAESAGRVSEGADALRRLSAPHRRPPDNNNTQPIFKHERLSPPAHRQDHQLTSPALNYERLASPALKQERLASPALNLERLASPAVKHERLTPPAQNRSSSSRSRSVTPSTSSYPGTPPERGASPAALLAPSYPAPIAPQPARNYSDIMRSLAARYNHATPEFFQNPRPTLAPGPAPLPAANGGPRAPLAPPAPVPDRAVSGLFAGFSRTNGGPHRVPAFPLMMDMTSTKTLLAIAKVTKPTREAEQHSRSKRAADHHASSPLDLSAARTNKRRRTSQGSSPLPPPLPQTLHHSPPPVSPASPACCGAGEGEDVAAWGVDEVCGFVESIDICAEYSPNFREQRIDGSGLPLLTEDHLTGMLSMKLGPALKMKALLQKKLGSCQQCCSCRSDRLSASSSNSSHQQNMPKSEPGNTSNNASPS